MCIDIYSFIFYILFQLIHLLLLVLTSFLEIIFILNQSAMHNIIQSLFWHGLRLNILTRLKEQREPVQLVRLLKMTNRLVRLLMWSVHFSIEASCPRMLRKCLFRIKIICLESEVCC